MSGFLLNEYMKEALEKEAYSCEPPHDLKQKIDARLAQQEKKEVISMKKFTIKKAVVAAVAACALTGSVCMAAEKISGYYFVSSKSKLETTADFSDIAKLEKKAGVKTGAIEGFANGFTFANANTRTTDETDAAGNVQASFEEVVITYENGAQTLDYAVSNSEIEYTKEELARAQKIESDGVTYYYNQSDYLFVPEGYEPTAEEQAAQEAGELFISIGTDEREENVFESLSWNVDGQRHMLYGNDLDIGAEGLADMAAQMK